MDANCPIGEPRTCGQNGTFYQYYGGLNRCGPTHNFNKIAKADDWLNIEGETQGIFSGKVWLFGCCWVSEVIEIQILNSLGRVMGGTSLEWKGRNETAINAPYLATP